jgi:hypothetical protein
VGWGPDGFAGGSGRRVPPRILTTCLLVLFAFGCDDDDEGRPPYRSGVTVGADGGVITVSDLPEPDLDRICQSYDVYVDTNISFDAIAYIACLPQAIVLSGGDSAECQRRLDACTDRFPEPIAIRAQVRDREVCYSTLRECRASVAEFEGCVNVNLDLALDILDNWTCGGAADLQEDADRAMDTVSACAEIDAACSDFSSFGPD